MVSAPEGMRIYEVRPRNYEKIIAESSSTQNPWSWDDLERMHAEALAQQKVALVMFMDQSFWLVTGGDRNVEPVQEPPATGSGS